MLNIIKKSPSIAFGLQAIFRVSLAAIWGVVFSEPTNVETKAVFASMLGLVALVCSPGLYAWDSATGSTTLRKALHGLLVAGEALGVGSIVTAAYWAFSGQDMHVLLYIMVGGYILLSVSAKRMLLSIMVDEALDATINAVRQKVELDKAPKDK